MLTSIQSNSDAICQYLGQSKYSLICKHEKGLSKHEKGLNKHEKGLSEHEIFTVNVKSRQIFEFLNPLKIRSLRHLASF